jgi:hypothetical protein
MTALMRIDCILTFDSFDRGESMQSFGNFDIEIEQGDTSRRSLLNDKFFPKLTDFCTIFRRDVRDLNTLSTSANWKIYSDYTGVEESSEYVFKWFFGEQPYDQHPWDLELTKKYGFGSNVDWSWMSADDPFEAAKMKKIKLVNDFFGK